MKLKYTVKVGYIYFNFSSGLAALQFAEKAALASREDEDIEIRIERVAVDVKAEAETPEAPLANGEVEA